MDLVARPANRAFHEVAGGVVTAVVSLTLSLSFGLIAFAALGPSFGSHAVVGGLVAGIVGQAAAIVSRDGLRSVHAPRSSTTLLLASLLLTLAADPALPGGDPARSASLVIAASGACVLLSGLFQIAFGLLGAGRLARYTPYPFLAGFMCGIAGLIVMHQLPVMLGMQSLDTSNARSLADSVDAGALVVGLATLAASVVVARRWPQLPALAIGLGAGLAAYLLLAGVAPRLDFGPRAAEASQNPAMLLTAALLFDPAWHALLLRHAAALAATALLIAAVGAMDGLLTAVAVDNLTGGERDTRRELVKHGLLNVACGVLGALPIALSGTNVISAWRSGARTRVPAIVAFVLLTLLLVGGMPVLRAIPQAVLAGVMIAVATSLVDHWTRGMIARLPGAHGRQDRLLPLSLGVVAIVALTTMFASMVTAVLVGMLLSTALLVASMHQSLVRTIVDGNTRPSRRMWHGAAAEQMERIRSRIRVIEIEGALFFGSAERLCDACERLAREADWLIVDFARVSTIDATGAVLLERLARRLGQRGAHLLLAGVTADGRHGNALAAYGAFLAPERPWFADVDRAMEHAESASLSRAGYATAVEVSLGEVDIVRGLSPVQVARLDGLLQRVEVAAGETLFRESDPGDRLFFLLRGSVTVTITLPGGGHSRIATFAPGSVFGEAALIDGRPRSGTAVASERAQLLALDRATLAMLRTEDPGLACDLLANLARLLVQRVRTTTDALRRLEDTLG